jgi:hypothetical protein
VLTEQVCGAAKTLVVHDLRPAGEPRRLNVQLVTSKISVRASPQRSTAQCAVDAIADQVVNLALTIGKPVMSGLDLHVASDVSVDVLSRVGTIQLDPPLHTVTLRLHAETVLVINLGMQGGDGERDFRDLTVIHVDAEGQESPCVLANADGDLHPGLPASVSPDAEQQYVVRWEVDLDPPRWHIAPVGRSPSGWPLLNA